MKVERPTLSFSRRFGFAPHFSWCHWYYTDPERGLRRLAFGGVTFGVFWVTFTWIVEPKVVSDTHDWMPVSEVVEAIKAREARDRELHEAKATLDEVVKIANARAATIRELRSNLDLTQQTSASRADHILDLQRRLRTAESKLEWWSHFRTRFPDPLSPVAFPSFGSSVGLRTFTLGTITTPKQDKALDELVADAERHGIVIDRLGLSVTFKPEVRPGRGCDIRVLYVDSDRGLEASIDVYGRTTVSYFSVDLCIDEHAPCSVCTLEDEADGTDELAEQFAEREPFDIDTELPGRADVTIDSIGHVPSIALIDAAGEALHQEGPLTARSVMQIVTARHGLDYEVDRLIATLEDDPRFRRNDENRMLWELAP